MKSRDAIGILVGVAVICVLVTAYTMGRRNGREQAQNSTGGASDENAIRGGATTPDASGAVSYPGEQAPVERQKSQTDEQTAMADAKQVALALKMYMQDYDGTFPPRSDPAGFNRTISPYVKDASPLLARGGVGAFQYIFDSKPPAPIANLSQTQLGYKQTSQGVAWVYADGHVQWEPTP